MDEQTKELIAIGASVASNCQPCLQFHVEKARQLGASERDITIACKVAEYVKAGATEKMAEYTKELRSDYSQVEVKDLCRCDE